MQKLTSFFNPVENSAKKRKTSQEDIDTNESTEPSEPQQVKSRSSSSSKLTFQPDWKKLYPWLSYRDGKMFCNKCLECPNLSNSGSSFVTGCDNFKIESLRSHAKSNGHVNAKEALILKANPEEAPLPRCLRTIPQEVREKLEKLIDLAYLVAKLELLFTVFPHLCAAEEKHGVYLGNTYRNDKYCKKFAVIAAEELKNQLYKEIQSARFIGIMTDGATDVGTREVEDVYVRFLNHGVPTNSFVGLRECPNAKAVGVTEAVTKVMDEVDEQWKVKAVCLGTDGANVMVGQHNSVFALLKREIPSLISIHCIAHKLELGFQDTIKDIPLVKEAKQMLQGIWKYYKYSGKAVRELKELAESFQERAYKAVKADGSRWIPHLDRALTVLLTKNYKLIVMHFQHASQARDSSAEIQGRATNY